MDDTGGIVWEVALCLFLSWLTVFCCLIKGIKSSGKAWLNAAVQIFYSLGPAWGGIVTLSSYNKFNNNLYMDSICISIANSATSIFAGFVIFSVLGYLAHEVRRDVSTVVSQGYGLAFIVYPEAVALLPVSPLWSILFFLMLIMLASNSHFGAVESFITALVDVLPVRWKKYKIYILMSYCSISFLVGLICTTKAGPYWANLIDQTAIGFATLLFAFIEAVGIGWIYGFNRLKNDIRSMIGDKWVDHWTFGVWPFLWCFLTPAILLTILVINFANWTYPTYNALFISWVISVSCFVSIPLVIIYYTSVTPGPMTKRLRVMLSPQDSWGPMLQNNRDYAWRCHQNHGTTMGGKLLMDAPSDANDMNHELSSKV